MRKSWPEDTAIEPNARWTEIAFPPQALNKLGEMSSASWNVEWHSLRG